MWPYFGINWQIRDSLTLDSTMRQLYYAVCLSTFGGAPGCELHRKGHNNRLLTTDVDLA
jgi:hypothetical protein